MHTFLHYKLFINPKTHFYQGKFIFAILNLFCPRKFDQIGQKNNNFKKTRTINFNIQ